jgi:hypothetical protein
VFVSSTFALDVDGAELFPGKLGRCHCRRHFSWSLFDR